MTVSTDPDVYLSISAPLRLDLGLPFLVTISLGNFSQSVAHDVDVTVDFRTDAGVQTLPAGCTNPVHGRIICHLDTLVPGEFPGQPNFAVTLIAPSTFESGSIVLTAKATEREQDFNPSSNSWTTAPQLYNTFYVTSTANDGTGSLRQAILDANASTNGPRAIGFRIEEPSPTPWKTIRITSPLPAITASGGVRVEGGIQSRFLGDTNPDGPEIEISGEGSVDGDGLLITDCATEIANLVINGFRRNGISAIATSTGCLPFPELHHLFIGTDPTGSEARPNGQRGIGISVPNGTDINQAGGGADIHDCVISGNALSGIFDLSGRLNVWGNRIGVKAGSDEPLTNGASGIFIGTGGWGSAIGPDILTSSRAGERDRVQSRDGGCHRRRSERCLRPRQQNLEQWRARYRRRPRRADAFGELGVRSAGRGADTDRRALRPGIGKDDRRRGHRPAAAGRRLVHCRPVFE